MMNIAEIYKKIKDGRGMSGRRYPFKAIAAIALYGIAAGRDSAESIWRFCNEKFDKKTLEELGFPEGKLPCARTLRRVFQQAELDFSQENFCEGKVYNMDGKSSRGAKNPGEIAAHLVNLIDSESRELVAQETCEKGGGTERKAAKEMIRKTDVKGAIITADAGFACGNLPAVIRDNEADYILRVKGNMPHLYELMKLRINQNSEKHAEKAASATITGGRIDEREIEILHRSFIEKVLPLGLADTVRFGRITKRSTHKKTGKTVTTMHYFVTSLPQEMMSADQALQIHREHWRVENDLHRKKDIYLREDACRLRAGNAPAIWAALRSFVCGILRKISTNFCEAIDKCAANHNTFFRNAT